MKKGLTTFEFLVAAILVLALAGVILYIVIPRLQHSPSFVEGFLPEKCAMTGKTRDDYYTAITQAISSIPPQTVKALQLNTEMKTCFSDAEMPGVQAQFIQATAKADIKKLRGVSSTSGLSNALKIYDNSKSIIALSEWAPDDLILFNRAMYVLDKSRSADALRILTEISKKRDATAANKVEATLMEGLWYQGDPFQSGKAKEKFDEIINKYQGKPEFAFYVGIALLNVGQYDKADTTLRNFLQTGNANDYERDFSMFSIGKKYALTNNERVAALTWETLLARADSSFYPPTLSDYAALPNKAEVRSILDCQYDVLPKTQCICRTKGIQILPAGAFKYCCNSGPSDIPCMCIEGTCHGYKTEKQCNEDQCHFAGQSGTSTWSCVWVGSSCKTRTNTYGGFTGGSTDT